MGVGAERRCGQGVASVPRGHVCFLAGSLQTVLGDMFRKRAFRGRGGVWGLECQRFISNLDRTPQNTTAVSPPLLAAASHLLGPALPPWPGLRFPVCASASGAGSVALTSWRRDLVPPVPPLGPPPLPQRTRRGPWHHAPQMCRQCASAACCSGLLPSAHTNFPASAGTWAMPPAASPPPPPPGPRGRPRSRLRAARAGVCT